ncbi:hypothetical protein [Staphylococcus haemolyticus]|nr:hypothetical protein [Staphylococcus haemolyticus]
MCYWYVLKASYFVASVFEWRKDKNVSINRNVFTHYFRFGFIPIVIVIA